MFLKENEIVSLNFSVSFSTKRADIVVAAIGQSHFLKAEMIKEGAVVIDVGISRTAT
jgi:methylenetetrahydrofolate dehydrogenase (NADP+)/methenyltetrahydrofolate cyclohydrolase